MPFFDSWDDYAWSAILLATAVVELVAMWNNTPGDTLSEHVWKFITAERRGWVGGWAHVRRTFLVLALCYLFIHFVTGGWI